MTVFVEISGSFLISASTSSTGIFRFNAHFSLCGAFSQLRLCFHAAKQAVLKKVPSVLVKNISDFFQEFFIEFFW